MKKEMIRVISHICLKRCVKSLEKVTQTAEFEGKSPLNLLVIPGTLSACFEHPFDLNTRVYQCDHAQSHAPKPAAFTSLKPLTSHPPPNEKGRRHFYGVDPDCCADHYDSRWALID